MISSSLTEKMCTRTLLKIVQSACRMKDVTDTSVVATFITKREILNIDHW